LRVFFGASPYLLALLEGLLSAQHRHAHRPCQQDDGTVEHLSALVGSPRFLGSLCARIWHLPILVAGQAHAPGLLEDHLTKQGPDDLIEEPAEEILAHTLMR
jgi:hypothetical protein